jgi:hypothetical protein
MAESSSTASEPAREDAPEQDFARQAEQAQPGIVAEFVDFLLHNKKWWLTPIVVVLLLVGLLVMFSGTAAAPFIYTLF